MKLKVMSYNTMHCENFITGKIDFDAFADYILESGAEIIGLNEIRGEGEKADYQAQAKILSEKTGYNYYFAKAIDVYGNNPYGNAILSKYPIISAETVMIPDPETRRYDRPYETRCVLKAEIDVEGQGICVLVTHFGLNPDETENAVKTVLSIKKDEKCLLMGDFNLTPDDGILMPIRAVMTDTADSFESEQLSWPSDTPEVKIDYIFHSNDIKTVMAEIPGKVLSDHRPYIAILEI